MADNNELQTARIIGPGPGSGVDNNFRDVEAALRTIFGITADSDYSESMQILTGPDVTMTGTMTLAADPTENLEAVTKQYVDGYGGGAAAVRCTVVLSSGQTISSTDNDALEWDAAQIEEGGNCWDIGDPSMLVFPVAGDYIIGGIVVASSTAPESVWFLVSIKLNGTTFIYEYLGTGYNTTGGSEDGSVPFAVMESMSSSDYVEVFVENLTGDDLVCDTDCYLWMIKVG